MAETLYKNRVPITLLQKYDRPGPRYTSYPTVPEWTESVGPHQYKAALQKASQTPAEPLSVYVHLPFCEKRCYFCACNVVIPTRKRNSNDYLEVLYREIENTSALLGARNKIVQLHFGGGTPTFLSVSQFATLLDKLECAFVFSADAEISIEVDPRVTTDEQLKYLRSRGFNRVSMGVQDFNPVVQKAINRIQPYEQTRHCVDYSRELGYAGVNIDLIYGLPHQNVAGFTETIDEALTLRPDRVALYSFAYLPESMKHQNLIKPIDLPELEVKAALFSTAHGMFSEAGYQHIGMDHFALPGDELSLAQNNGKLQRNFMGYTTKVSPDLIGLGVSGIGYVSDTFVQNHAKLETYQESIQNGGFATHRGLKLAKDDLIRQYVISSIMCNFKLDFQKLQEKFSVSFHDYFSAEFDQLGPFTADGIIILSDDSLCVTALGRTFVRNVSMIFDAYLRSKPAADRPAFSRTI